MNYNFVVSMQSWREGVRTFTPPTLMSCRERKKERKKRTKQSQTKKIQEKINILSYHPHQSEKNNCLGRTELAGGKTLKSCEIFPKAVFSAGPVECTINAWIVDHSYFQKLANGS